MLCHQSISIPWGYLAKERYSEKLMVNGKEIQDTYKIPVDSWIDDVTKWSKVEFGDLYTYLIETKGQFTKENLRAYKSLETYNYFYNPICISICTVNGRYSSYVLY